MKKLLFIVTVLLVSQINAQGLKGTWFATANLSYSSNGAEVATKNTTILPIVGTFITDNVAVGLGAGILSTKVGDADANNTTVIEPLVRKYWNVSGNLFFFGQAAVPVILSDGVTTYGATLTPGLDYVVNKHFTVEFSHTIANLSFTSVDGGDTSTNFSLNGMGHTVFGGASQVGFKFLF
jgi:hypothetical protein